VIVTGALISLISLQMETSVFVTTMASMIGIGVAVDYSLFILARYREERAAGRGQDDARAEALSTSGLAVSFSGLAVIVSLAGLWMVAFKGKAAAPGRGSEGPSISDSLAPRGSRGGGGYFWKRWTENVMARPWVAALGASAVLLFLAIPVLSLTTGTEALGQFPKGSDVRVGNELASEQLDGGTDPVSAAKRRAARTFAG